MLYFVVQIVANGSLSHGTPQKYSWSSPNNHSQNHLHVPKLQLTKTTPKTRRIFHSVPKPYTQTQYTKLKQKYYYVIIINSYSSISNTTKNIILNFSCFCIIPNRLHQTSKTFLASVNIPGICLLPKHFFQISISYLKIVCIQQKYI